MELAEARKEPDQEIRIVLDALRHIVQEMRSFSAKTESRVGLTAAQLFALQVLARAAPLTVNELAAGTFTHQSSVSVVAQRLVAKKLVRRRTSSEDRRRVLLELTAAGRRTAEQAPAALQDRLIQGLSHLSSDERRTLGILLGKVVVDIAPDAKVPHMFFDAAPDETGDE